VQRIAPTACWLKKTQRADCEQVFTFDQGMRGLARVKLP